MQRVLLGEVAMPVGMSGTWGMILGRKMINVYKWKLTLTLTSRPAHTKLVSNKVTSHKAAA